MPSLNILAARFNSFKFAMRETISELDTRYFYPINDDGLHVVQGTRQGHLIVKVGCRYWSCVSSILLNLIIELLYAAIFYC